METSQKLHSTTRIPFIDFPILCLYWQRLGHSPQSILLYVRGQNVPEDSKVHVHLYPDKSGEDTKLQTEPQRLKKRMKELEKERKN